MIKKSKIDGSFTLISTHIIEAVRTRKVLPVEAHSKLNNEAAIAPLS